MSAVKPLPKTIQIFLPDGNARSIRIADITSRTVQAIQIPRSKLKEASQRSEPQSVGVYFLFGEDEEASKSLVYIGEAEDCYHRLKQHHQSKDFWTTAVVIISKTSSFTKAHGKYLEWYCIEEATRAGRYTLVNSSTPNKPFISEPVEADLLDNFETLRVLLSTLGFPVLEEIKRPASARALLYCTGRGASGTGEYIEDGFVVFAGATAALTETKSAQGSWVTRVRDKLKKASTLVLSEDGTHYEFVRDHVFNSPSGAAVTILGRNANGWKSWKNKQGQTLDELERQPDKTEVEAHG